MSPREPVFHPAEEMGQDKESVGGANRLWAELTVAH